MGYCKDCKNCYGSSNYMCDGKEVEKYGSCKYFEEK